MAMKDLLSRCATAVPAQIVPVWTKLPVDTLSNQRQKIESGCEFLA